MTGCLIVGVLGVLIQYALIPFYAPPGFGLFANGGDLWVYRLGAEHMLSGHSLYDAPIPHAGWFTYPPFAALMFVPFTWGNPGTVWFLVNVVVLGLTIWRCLRVSGFLAGWHLGLAAFGLTLAAINIEAVRGTLWQGQINLVLMAVIVWDLTRPQGALLRGWSVGLAAGIKLTALLFVPYLLVTRQWRPAAAAVGTAIVTVLIGAVVLPRDTATYWLHAVGDVRRIGDVTHPANQSVNGVIANLLAPGTIAVAVWVVFSALVVGLALWAASRLHRSGEELPAIAIVGLAACAATPLAWSHHWVWFIPVIAYLLYRSVAGRSGLVWRWRLVTVGVVAATSMWLTTWIYVLIKSIGETDAVGYVPAMDAAITHIPTGARLLTCGLPVLLLVALCLGALAITRNSSPTTGIPSGRTEAKNLEKAPGS
ncbi:hypothetical protein GCM10011410_21100 [Hoyosella rhizosphaerae]|uniref:DUF2029 domain-containing protein n=1 Tax=Hoyosella rhizosphaerae TaxID=1755582 RepID=A0A916UDA9_9ACTN|nr:hypothetical protein GCM10011410_21100 [Hoyosella rhizosphaerae]